MLANRVRERTSTIGDGEITLDGAAYGAASFSAAYNVGDEAPYIIEENGHVEIGRGTLTSATTFRRDVIEATIVDGVYSDTSPEAIHLSGAATIYVGLTLSEWNSKSDVGHGHVISDVIGLQTALDGKATSAQGALADSAVQPGDTPSFYRNIKLTLNPDDSSFWMHVYDDNFYILTDWDSPGDWGPPYPLKIENSTQRALVYGHEVWTTANHGAGSGLDADLLDGMQATAFATSAQGVLADSAVQPGDNAELSSLTLLESPANSDHAVTKGYVDARSDNILAVAGSAPTLDLNFADIHDGVHTHPGSLPDALTTVRASTATRVNGIGQIETVAANQPRLDHRVNVLEQRTNLLLRSQDLNHGNTPWGRFNGLVVTPNIAIAPDGTLTADKVTTSGSSTNSRLQQTVAGLVPNTDYTLSFWAKAADDSVSSIFRMDFNLEGGTAVSVSKNITPSGDWQRYSYTLNSDDNTQARFWPVRETGGGVSSVLVWGVQLEQGSFATNYIPTTTAPVTQTKTEIEPLGLLVEEQRTNLLLHSEAFTNAVWTKSNSSVNANAVKSPDGGMADKLVEDNASVSHGIRQTASSGTSSDFTFSVFLKAAERRYARLMVADVGLGSGSRYYVMVDLINGVVTSEGSISATNAHASVEPYGNGWFRCTVSASLDVSGTTTQTSIYLSDIPNVSSVITSYTGDGTSGIYVWGAQLEQGSFATSYIPTTTAQVTRAADQASLESLAGVSTDGAGTYYFEFERNEKETCTVFAANNGGFGDRVFLSFVSPTNLRLTVINSAGTVVSLNNTIPHIPGSKVRVAFCLSDNDYAMSVNGGAAKIDTVGAMPDITRFVFGSESVTSFTNHMNSGVLRAIHWPTRLSDTTLQELTA